MVPRAVRLLLPTRQISTLRQRRGGKPSALPGAFSAGACFPEGRFSFKANLVAVPSPLPPTYAQAGSHHSTGVCMLVAARVTVHAR